MKTKLTLIAAIASACMTASATTLAWGGNAATAQIFGLTSGTAMTVGASSETASMTMYYFLASDYDTIVGLGKVEATDLSDYVVASAAGQTSTSTSAAGRVKGSTTTTAYTEPGVSFFARAYATFDSKTYFIDLFGGSASDGTWTTTLSGDQSTKETLAWSNGTYGGSTSTSVGTKNSWVAVPEPSTAMLALAGLALLIKRRRA